MVFFLRIDGRSKGAEIICVCVGVRCKFLISTWGMRRHIRIQCMGKSHTFLLFRHLTVERSLVSLWRVLRLHYSAPHRPAFFLIWPEFRERSQFPMRPTDNTKKEKKTEKKKQALKNPIVSPRCLRKFQFQREVKVQLTFHTIRNTMAARGMKRSERRLRSTASGRNLSVSFPV